MGKLSKKVKWGSLVVSLIATFALAAIGAFSYLYNRPPQELGLFIIAPIVFFGAILQAIFRDKEHGDRLTPFDIGIASMFFAGIAIFSFVGFRGDESWLDFLFFRVWIPGFCSSALAASYGGAAAAMLLALLDGITSLNRLFR